MSETVTTQQEEGTSPRILVHIKIYKPHSDEVDRHAWEAMQPQGVIGDGPGYERDVIGFAEFPPNHAVGRYSDIDRFIDHIEWEAVYFHWKPVEQSMKQLQESDQQTTTMDYESIEDIEQNAPDGFAICDCGDIIFFGGCSECDLSEDDLTFHSADSS